jgi:hypothetical protein
MEGQMNKSVLIIETPKSCSLCNLRTNCGQCEICIAIEGYRIINKYSEENIKPDWCPLVPLPTYKDLKKYTDKINGNMMLSYQFDRGYNTCLQEIEGENENV